MKIVLQVILMIATLSGALVSISCQRQNAAQPAANTNRAGKIEQVSVEQTNKAIQNGGVQFIDVRTTEEFADEHAVGAVNHPLDNLEAALTVLEKKKPVYVICATGRRSQKGAEILEKNGFEEVYNVTGGTSAWVSAGLPVKK